MIADELDLHYTRAPFKESYPLSNVSKLHYFRHYYIENIEVLPCYDGIHESHRQIHIVFRFPHENANDKEWCENLKKWVESKITKEASRTGRILHTGFKTHFRWSTPITICRIEEALENEKTKMEKEVQLLLEEEFKKPPDWNEITEMYFNSLY